MEQVRMSPIGAFSFIAGKTLPYFVLSLFSAIIVVVAWWLRYGYWRLLWATLVKKHFAPRPGAFAADHAGAQVAE